MNPPTAGRQLLRPQLAMRAAVVERLAAARGMAAWLVGGTVRDLLLDRDSPDLDFVVEADAPALAALAADIQRELGGRVVRHPAFLTADVIDGAGFHLDVAGARRETYAAMAALPDVQAAGIEEDLWRRDFTVNAMAMPLGALAADGLLDPCGGRRDLAARALAVLHERSFLDDPTRVLRGVRFEARLGFHFAAATEELARQAVAAGAFARLSGSRLRREMELLLGAEPLPAMALAGLERLADLGVLTAIHPRLAFDGAARRRVQEAALEWAWHQGAMALRAPSAPQPPRPPEPPVRPWLLLLMALLGGLDAEARREAAQRLALAGEELRLATSPGATAAGAAVPAAPADDAGGLAALAARLRGTARPSEVDAALAPLGGEELLLLAAVGGAQVRAWVRRYWLEMRPLAAAVGGADLVAAGAPSGPAIGRALRAARAARLDGEIAPEEELGFALAHLGDDQGRNVGVRGGEGGAGER